VDGYRPNSRVNERCGEFGVQLREQRVRDANYFPARLRYAAQIGKREFESPRADVNRIASLF